LSRRFVCLVEVGTEAEYDNKSGWWLGVIAMVKDNVNDGEKLQIMNRRRSNVSVDFFRDCYILIAYQQVQKRCTLPLKWGLKKRCTLP
jgi:hypothetical protein